MAIQNDIRRELCELRINHTGTDKAVRKSCKFSGLEKFMQDLSAKCDEIHALRTTLSSLEETVSHQNGKLTELEDLGRRSKFVVFGIHEAPNELEGDIRFKLVVRELSQKLGVSRFFVARIHDLGRN